MSRRTWGRGQSRGVPEGYYTWYDWALVYRWWVGDSAGLRHPYLLEIRELLRLGAEAGLSHGELASRLGVADTTVYRWARKSNQQLAVPGAPVAQHEPVVIAVGEYRIVP